MVSSGEQIHVKMSDLFYSWKPNLVIDIHTIVGFTLLMTILRWFSFIWLSSAHFVGVYDPDDT